MANRDTGLAAQRGLERGGVDIGIAVAVSPNPAAGAQEGRRCLAKQRFPARVEPRKRRNKTFGEIRERRFNLILNDGLHRAQRTRLPEDRDLADERGLSIAFVQKRGNHRFTVNAALAPHFGGVCGKHWGDQRSFKQCADINLANACTFERL